MNLDFQTPKSIARYMVSLIPDGVNTILEPTPGRGNITSQLNGKYDVTAPDDFFLLKPQRFDCIIMNPPFSDKYCCMKNAPEYVKKLEGARVGYWFLFNLLDWSDNIIALMPWYTIVNSRDRAEKLFNYGLVSVTNLYRQAFKNARIFTCILNLKNGYRGITEFKQL